MVRLEVGRNLSLHPVAVLEQLLLVVQQLLARLGRKLCVLGLDDRVDRAGFLAELREWVRGGMARDRGRGFIYESVSAGLQSRREIERNVHRSRCTGRA